MHAAATTGNTDSTRLLLARGADPLRKNADGETPLDVARRNKGRGGAESGLLGGNLVSVLEGAVEEAAAAKAAIEAEKSAKSVKEEYQGDGVYSLFSVFSGERTIVHGSDRSGSRQPFPVWSPVHEPKQPSVSWARRPCRGLVDGAGRLREMCFVFALRHPLLLLFAGCRQHTQLRLQMDCTVCRAPPSV